MKESLLSSEKSRREKEDRIRALKKTRDQALSTRADIDEYQATIYQLNRELQNKDRENQSLRRNLEHERREKQNSQSSKAEQKLLCHPNDVLTKEQKSALEAAETLKVESNEIRQERDELKSEVARLKKENYETLQKSQFHDAIMTILWKLVELQHNHEARISAIIIFMTLWQNGIYPQQLQIDASRLQEMYKSIELGPMSPFRHNAGLKTQAGHLTQRPQPETPFSTEPRIKLLPFMTPDEQEQIKQHLEHLIAEEARKRQPTAPPAHIINVPTSIKKVDTPFQSLYGGSNTGPNIPMAGGHFSGSLNIRGAADVDMDIDTVPGDPVAQNNTKPKAVFGQPSGGFGGFAASSNAGQRFGQPSTFGGSSNTAPAFGHSSGFGVSAAPASTFGRPALSNAPVNPLTNAPMTTSFGKPSGAAVQPSAFGQSAFGQPSFGQPSAFSQSRPAPPAFGQPSSGSTFGSAPAHTMGSTAGAPVVVSAFCRGTSPAAGPAGPAALAAPAAPAGVPDPAGPHVPSVRNPAFRSIWGSY